MREVKQFRVVMGAEMTPDCEGGEKFDEKIPLWKTWAEGDFGYIKEPEFSINAKNFPAGTKILIKVPLCPDCEEDADMCKCGFDWNAWIDYNYS